MSQDAQAAKDTNRRQFGENAQNYASSKVHAKGASLARMVELAEPQNDWHALDIATAAGHTAFAFAPHVAQVTATDLTPEMIALAAERAQELDVANVSTEIADAEALPFEDNSYDLVTCRIAPHHFPSPGTFVAEVARVLRPSGTFVMVDNVAADDHEVALFCDDWESQRDPSHVGCLSLDEWTNLCELSGLTVSHSELAPKRMRFLDWVGNMNVSTELRPQLLDDLLTATPAVRQFLKPEGSTQEDAFFTLTEGLLVARPL